jgi:hypothetical protein
MEVTEELKLSIPVAVMDQIYIALHDSRERIVIGVDQITQCINYLEKELGYARPVDKRNISEAD